MKYVARTCCHDKKIGHTNHHHTHLCHRPILWCIACSKNPSAQRSGVASRSNKFGCTGMMGGWLYDHPTVHSLLHWSSTPPLLFFLNSHVELWYEKFGGNQTLHFLKQEIDMCTPQKSLKFLRPSDHLSASVEVQDGASKKL